MSPPAPDEDLELRHYVDVLRRRKVSVIVTVVVVMAAGFGITLLQSAKYRSTAEVLVEAPLSERILAPTADLSRGEPAGDSDVATQVAVLESAAVRNAVENELGRKVDVSIKRNGDSNVVEITASDTEAARAGQAAKSYTDRYLTMRREQLTTELATTIDAVKAEIGALDGLLAGYDQQIQDLNTQIQASLLREVRAPLEARRDQLTQQRAGPEARRSELQQRLDRLQLASNVSRTGGVALLSEASAPTRPDRPLLVRNLAVALALGMVLGVVVAFVRDHFDETVKDAADLDGPSGRMPLVGRIPAVPGWRNRDTVHLVARSAPRSPPAEAYGRVRTSLELAGATGPGRLLQVTSAGPGDGKTTTLCNLGVSFARAGRRVLLIDCNLRRPRLHRFFDLDNEIGLTSVLLRQTPISEAVRTVPDLSRLKVLPSGRPPPNPSELLSTESVQQLISSLATQADVVLVDSPPLPVSDAIVLAGRVDAVVLVVCAGRTARHHVAEALALLEQIEAPLVGTILNSTHDRIDHGLTYGREQFSPRRRARRSGSVRTSERADADATPEPVVAPKLDTPMPVDS